MIAIILVVTLLLVAKQVPIPVHPDEVPESTDSVDNLIRQLSTPAGKAQYHGFLNPGGPIFLPSPAMTELIARGRAIQPRLIETLGNPEFRNEVALVLAEVGDKEALPRLIEYLPSKETLSEEEDYSTMCLLYALRGLTGLQLGISSKFGPHYTPETQALWRRWYETNRDYLYSPPLMKVPFPGQDPIPVLVDVEAKLAGRPTEVYRKENPWVSYDEIKTWRDDPDYVGKLKTFCYSVILNPRSGGDQYTSRDTLWALVHVRDSRATAALHAFCARATDAATADDLLWAIAERADPAFLPFIENAPRSEDPRIEAERFGPRRRRAAEQIRLLNKYRAELTDIPLDLEWQKLIAECRESQAGVDRLLGCLRKRNDSLSDYLRVAGYVDREPVRNCLKDLANDKTISDQSRMHAYAALARLKEPGFPDHLREGLLHKHPGVRLAAAEGLWRVGNREGYKTLLNILDVRPVETGSEGVEIGNGSIITVSALRDTNVELIRDACRLLGEMGDRSAIEPLKRVLALNLNGVNGSGGSGTCWPGRPDAVALARLGDDSGIGVLRASLENGDRVDVLGSWWHCGDYVKIGEKRYIPDLVPMLEHHDQGKQILAAREILLLLENGR